MIRHVVLFRWKSDADPEAIGAVAGALAALPSQIPVIGRYEFGPDAGIRPGEYDFALVADFDDEEAYLSYADDPVHLDFIERFIKPIRDHTTSVQYRI